jgi:hypothetical protein
MDLPLRRGELFVSGIQSNHCNFGWLVTFAENNIQLS